MKKKGIVEINYMTVSVAKVTKITDILTNIILKQQST